MTSGPGSSAAGSPGEVLHDSDRSRVTRESSADGAGTVICKEFRGPSACARMRNEAATLRRLAGLPGVPRLVRTVETDCQVVVEDAGGVPLAEAVAAHRGDQVWVLRTGIALAGVLAGMHRRAVVHGDVNPSNILHTPDGPLLIDFALARVVALDGAEYVPRRGIAGTLAYLAPEQTGRTGRPVDHRADLYALGVTLYQLATGELPFRAHDVVALLHAHLAEVPDPPVARDPQVPPELSAIILRLLRKEPDRRYQSAEGVCHDLTLVLQRVTGEVPGDHELVLGTRDFPARLTAPSGPVGRDSEVAQLRAGYEAARTDSPRALLIGGAPGTGKTFLASRLRPVVTARGGWFVTVRFDQYHPDQAADALVTGLRGLCRMLLAEPEEHLRSLRRRALAALGPDAGLLVGTAEEVATLLGDVTKVSGVDPARTRVRTYRAVAALLGAVASPARPVVVVFDNLQWADDFALGIVDTLLEATQLSGIVVVGTYRQADAEGPHPLRAALDRWQDRGDVVLHLRLGNLSVPDLATLLARMLRLAPSDAAELARPIAARSDGNPSDAVELVNALRQDGLLVPGDTGWRWDAEDIVRYVGATDVVELVRARVERLPAATRRLMTILAALGGEVELTVLATAADLTPAVVEEQLTAGLRDGVLVVARHGDDVRVRFRRDRVEEVVHGLLDPDDRDRLHLELARRLAAYPDLAGVTAEQYLPVVDGLDDPVEGRGVADLFLTAAHESRVTSPTTSERFAAAAAHLLERGGAAADDPLLVRARTAWHAALYGLGSLERADAVYAAIEGSRPAGQPLPGPGCVQISSLTNRNRSDEAVRLGLDLLRRLGESVPEPDRLRAAAVWAVADLQRWLADPARGADTGAPQLRDPRLRAVTQVIDALMAPTYFGDQDVMAWLVLRAVAIWAEHGPCAELVGTVTHAVLLDVADPADLRVCHDVVRHVLAVSEERGFEPATSLARFRLSVVLPWCGPLEDAVEQAELAREGLLRAGSLQAACFTFTASVQSFLGCAPDLDTLADLAGVGSAFATRTGNRYVAAYLAPYRQLVRALRGETFSPDRLSDAEFDQAEHLRQVGHDPTLAAQVHVCGAVATAVLGDLDALDERTAVTLEVIRRDPATVGNALARLLRALALAHRARTGADADGSALAQLDECRGWLAARAVQAPANFTHLVALVDAERAWATGDRWGALTGFAAALKEVSGRSRPWQQALIHERAGVFHREHGLEPTAAFLLAEARRLYQAWGASAKVRALDEQYPFLRTARPKQDVVRSLSGTSDLSPDTIDLLGVLRASQALSRETDLNRLRRTLAEVLTTMTGATGIQIAVCTDDSVGWFLTCDAVVDPADPADPADRGDPAAAGPRSLLPVEEAAERGLLPMSAFRYAERTREPLLVDDAVNDLRLDRDPYFAALDTCSLLVVPVLSKGAPRAMLLLENRIARAAFTPEQVNAVKLIAGQLAVSLDNALAERFRSLVQRSADLTLVTDRSGVISYATPSSQELLGRRHATLVGNSVQDLAMGSDAGLLLEHVRLAEPGPVRTLQCRLLHADGSSRSVEASFTDLTADPAVRGVMVRLSDISERLRLESELRHAQKLESVGQLAAGIAHEINTPIQFIRDNLHFLNDAVGRFLPHDDGDPGSAAAEPDPQDDAEFLVEEIPLALRESMEGAERVARIVQAMKVFGHQGSETKALHDLNDAVRNTLVVAGVEIRPVADVVEDLADLPPVNCVIGDINQVVLNLVVNAAQAIREKYARTGERGTLTVRTRAEGGDVLIDVQDTGTGIPARIADRVFDQFFTTKDVGVGTGQGLALAHSLVHDRHQGTLSFVTTPDVGTTFTVRLPI